MKPFFSIRVEYNPADAYDQSHRDGHAVRMTVARQVPVQVNRLSPMPAPGQDSVEAQKKAHADDQKSIVSAIVRAVMFLDRVRFDSGEYDLADDVIFELANRSGDMEAAVGCLVDQTIKGCDEGFLDALQKMIDKERGVKTVLTAGMKNVLDDERSKQTPAGGAG